MIMQRLFQQSLAVLVDLGVQFLDTVIDMPAFVHVVFVVLKTVEVPQYLSTWSMFSSCSSSSVEETL